MSEPTREPFGTLPDGTEVHLFRFRNAKNCEITATDFGGRIVNILVPDRTGNIADVALGFDDLSGYLAKNPYFGALIGRYANRIGNAQFQLDGKTYRLDANNGPSTLHGGKHGFDSKLWDARTDGNALELRYSSPDGEEGFPGKLDAVVRYSLNDSNEFRIEFSATCDKPTVLNLTNHSYFNLRGNGAGEIVDHVVEINADNTTPTDANQIPTGEIRGVEGTPFDFRKPSRIADRIDADDPQLKLGLGYDHNFVLNRDKEGELTFAARAVDPTSGRMLEVFTTQPGVQFYTGNHLDGSVHGKNGANYSFRTGFCFETQHFPDSPNHPEFPSTVLRPGQTFQSTTIFRFGIF